MKKTRERKGRGTTGGEFALRSIATRLVAFALVFGSLSGGSSYKVQARPVVAGFERFSRSDSPGTTTVDPGLLLLNELNCVACHPAPADWRERLPGRESISLIRVGSRLGANGLEQFISAPHDVKPGTTMPAMFRENQTAAATAMARYLDSLRAPEVKMYPEGDSARGRSLYTTIGCAACHAGVDTTSSLESIPLGLAGEYSRNGLAAFLQNRLHTRPGGRMPAFELSDAEAADLASYLQSNRPQPVRTGPGVGVTDRRLEEEGRAQFALMNCAACHDDGTGAVARQGTPLNLLRDEQGCLAANPAAGVPLFALDSQQKRAIASALQTIRSRLVPLAVTAEQRLSERFAQLNCYACHEWRGVGGIAPELAKHLSAATGGGESLGEPGYLPPRLDVAGRKLTPAWLEKLLWGDGGGVRPYLTLRMPRFGRQATDLVPLLAEACRPDQPLEIDTSGTKGHQRSATGRILMGTGEGGLGCVACHGMKDRDPSGVRAINLSSTAQRLRPEYFKALLMDPQGLQPGTIMPPLLAGRPNASKEVESLWTYLKELDQNPRLPEGLEVLGSFELKPESQQRPTVFRTFLDGAGTRAIAVGYPQGVHVAFDGFEVRWALAWRGRFLDAMSNWEERAMPPVKPLGEDRHAFPARMPLARLRATTDAWPHSYGSDAGYSFRGYRIASDGVPVFLYKVDGIEVEDVVRPEAGSRALVRTVTLRLVGERADDWFFWGLVGDRGPQRVVWTQDMAAFEERITW